MGGCWGGVVVCSGAGTKCHRLQQQTCASPRVWMLQVSGLVSGEGSAPGLQVATPPSSCVLTRPFLGHVWGIRGASLVPVLTGMLRTLAPWDQGPTLITPLNLNYFLRGPISKHSHTGVRASTYNLGGWENTNIQSLTKWMSWGPSVSARSPARLEGATATEAQVEWGRQGCGSKYATLGTARHMAPAAR